MKINKTIVLVMIIGIISPVIYAQPGFAPDTGDVAPIPGIVVAMAAALGIGIYSLKRKNK